MSTNEEELLDQIERRLDRLFFAVIEGSKESLFFLPAIEQGRSGVQEIQEQFQLSSDLRQLELEVDEVWKTFDESNPHEGKVAQRAEGLREWWEMLKAAVAQISIGPALNVGIGGISAFERDSSGERISQFLESLFGVDFAKRHVVLRGDEDPIGSARHIGNRAAFKFCSRDVFDRAETLCGKGPAYFAKILRNEQGRNIRNEEIEDRDILGLKPKESKDRSKEDREFIQAANQTAANSDDLATAAAFSSPATPEEIALAQEEEQLTEATLNQIATGLPTNQRRLFNAIRGGESSTEARRRLGLPRSTENALGNKIRQWRRERQRAS